MMDLNDILDRTGSVDLDQVNDEPSLAPTDEDASSQEEDLDWSTLSPSHTTTLDDSVRHDTIIINSSFHQSGDWGRGHHCRSESNVEDQSQASSQQSDTVLQDWYQQKTLVEHQQADEVRSVFADPSMWHFLDHFQLECLGMGDCFDTSLPSMRVHRQDAWSWFEHEKAKENEKDVVMKVEATALSDADIYLEMQLRPDDKVPGTNAVGVVHHCSARAEEAGIKPGMRIAAIMQPNGSNARYFSVPSSEVLAVPRHLDACDVACVTTSYLPAFQALHHGRDRPYRYSRTCLEGSRVFVVGGDQLVAQATVRLAQLAGAKYVYISGPKCIQAALQKCTAFVLDDDPSGWPQEVYGSMDVIIDYQFPARFEEVTKTMAPKSRLVCCTPDNWNRRQENDLWSDLHHFTECLLLSSIKRATLFDFQESYKTNKYELKEDLHFLLTALTRRHIRPQIDRYVMLGDVPKVYQELRKTPPTGSIVCEPWRE